MGKGKKGQKTGAQPESKPATTPTQTAAQVQAQADKNKETQQIMNAITNMNLDNVDFIDINAFDQSKAILVNALD